MDQNTAKRLLSEGAFFIFLNVPIGTEFGIDMKSWNTGEKFRGVKMIPPGVHFVFYSCVNDTDVAPRTGFFYNFKRSEVVVRKWDKELETMSSENISETEIVNLNENILMLDGFLGPYPYDILEKWTSLTSKISDNLIHQLTPASGQIQSALELQSCTDAERPRGSKEGTPNSSLSEASTSCSDVKKPRLSIKTESLLPSLKPIEGTQLRLTPLPAKNFPEGSTPSEITQHCLDSTFAFETMISKYSKPMDIIGEIEFCFVCFLVGHSMEAFDQWKKLIALLCSCDVAIKKYRRIFDAFITLLEIHVKEVPEEFLADIVSNNNFIYVNLKKFFQTIHSSDIDGQLKTKVDRFKNVMSTTYLWDFDHLDSEDEDEAPVIVET